MQAGPAAANPIRHIKSHTGLRGIAALLVVAYHLQYGGGHHLAWEDLSAFFRRGYLWVDLFFVLSGFIISYTFHPARTTHVRLADAKAFWWARIARVYPLHLFCLAYLVGFWTLVTLLRLALDMSPPEVWSRESAVALVRQLLLLDAWGFGPGQTWNIPSWSIGAELLAYGLFPGLAIMMQKRRNLTSVILLAQSLAFYVLVATTTGSLDITRGLAVWRCLAGFSLGVLVYSHRARMAALPQVLLSAAHGGAVLLLVMVLAGALPDVYFVLASVILVATTWTDRGLLALLLSSKPLQWLGKISYSVYLNHVCLIAIAGYFWVRIEPALLLSPTLARVSWLLIATLLTLAVSVLTYEYVEVPWRRRLLRAGHAAGAWAAQAPEENATQRSPVRMGG